MTPPPKKQPLEEAIERIGATLSAEAAAQARLVALLDSAAALGILPVRLLLFAAAWPGAIPVGETAAEFVRNCTQSGWQAFPSLLPGFQPRTGDLFVLTGEGRAIVEVGLVGAVDREGTFFYGVAGNSEGPVPEWRRRRVPGEAAFFLRVPG